MYMCTSVSLCAHVYSCIFMLIHALSMLWHAYIVMLFMMFMHVCSCKHVCPCMLMHVRACMFMPFHVFSCSEVTRSRCDEVCSQTLALIVLVIHMYVDAHAYLQRFGDIPRDILDNATQSHTNVGIPWCMGTKPMYMPHREYTRCTTRD